MQKVTLVIKFRNHILFTDYSCYYLNNQVR
jgi:hypothetical protein